jgi:predicted RNA-binding Zn-ribbon protein involved in translation (DUF1610 family)
VKIIRRIIKIIGFAALLAPLVFALAMNMNWLEVSENSFILILGGVGVATICIGTLCYTYCLFTCPKCGSRASFDSETSTYKDGYDVKITSVVGNTAYGTATERTSSHTVLKNFHCNNCGWSNPNKRGGLGVLYFSFIILFLFACFACYMLVNLFEIFMFDVMSDMVGAGIVISAALVLVYAFVYFRYCRKNIYNETKSKRAKTVFLGSVILIALTTLILLATIMEDSSAIMEELKTVELTTSIMICGLMVGAVAYSFFSPSVANITLGLIMSTLMSFTFPWSYGDGSALAWIGWIVGVLTLICFIVLLVIKIKNRGQYKTKKSRR